MNKLKNISVLIVDNLQQDKDYLVSILLNHTQNIYTASNGEEALSIYNSNNIDIVLSDIIMPDMDGLTMSQHIRAINNEQIIILMDEFDDKNHLLNAINLGITNYLVKPIREEENLLSILNKSIESIITNQQLQEKNYLIRQHQNIIDTHILQVIYDLDGNTIDVTQALLDITDFTKDEFFHENCCSINTNYNKTFQTKAVWEIISNNNIWKGELDSLKRNGEKFWVNSVINPLFDSFGKKIGYRSIKEDITYRKKFEELTVRDALTSLYNRKHFEFYIKQELNKASLAGGKIALLLVDIDYFKNYNDIYGHEIGDKTLIKFANIVSSHINSKIDNAFRVSGKIFAIVIKNKEDEDVIEYINTLQAELKDKAIEHTGSGVDKYLTVSIGALNIDLKSQLYTADEFFSMTENSLCKAKETGNNKYIFTNKIYNNCFTYVSQISKLKNRNQLIDDLSQIQNNAMLVIFQVSQIKTIESLYGMETVTQVLIDKTKELKTLLIDENVDLYKINFKEFALLIRNEKLFEKYTSLIESFLINHVNNEELNTKDIVANFTAGASSGITDLLNNSSQALLTALNQNIRFYTYDEDKNIDNENVNIDHMIDMKVYRDALYEGNIYPFFQPIVDVHTQKIVKYEALARIITEKGTVISPYYFLKASQDDKSFEFFTRQLMQKIFNVYSKNDIEISINLTYENILSQTMVAYIKNRLDKFGGAKITFEIVESEDIKDYEIILDFISMVKEYGCKISIDDFGTGYSNFINLIKLDADYIKLDGSLIEKILEDHSVQTMVQALVTFANSTKMKTIAEYVSSKELAQAVKEYGINLSQGYYYGEPKQPKEYGLIV